MNTSSTTSPMALCRAARCLIATAARSSGRTRDKPPSKRPIGVRTKSQMKASLIASSFDDPLHAHLIACSFESAVRALDVRPLVESDQFIPCALGGRLVVDGLAVLQRHVLDAPPMQRAFVDFGLRGKIRCAKCLIE